ncbi:TPA: GIY-YIG nuclease family protein [Bacillus toyonensis]|nr:GIY-YIG nuclease family protein [Bacillus toyonensis]
MQVEELVYGDKGNETYLTLFLNRIEVEDFDKLQNRAGVYIIYNTENEPIYIGETSSVGRRVKEHLIPSNKKRIEKDTIGYVSFNYLDNADRYERSVIEGLLVQKYRPALNCDDMMLHDGMTERDTSLIRDVIFYIRNTTLSNRVISMALDVNTSFVKNIRTKGTHNAVKLPSGYQPSVTITQDMIEKALVVKRINQTEFNEIREMFEAGQTNQCEIARKYRVSANTIRLIKILASPRYKKWEEQRTGKAVA